MASAGCVGDVGPGAMAYVGSGQGDYVTETTYKYVGHGVGNLAVVTPRVVLVSRILCCVVPLLALLLLAVLLMQAQGTTSSTPASIVAAPILPPSLPPRPQPLLQPTVAPVRPPTGVCTFWGDPHVQTFDGARPSFYGAGELWIVRSDTVWIQGRYMGTPWTKGLAATNKIAVGGPFLGDHTIMVGSLDSGAFEVDGRSILPDFGTHRVDDLAVITYNDEGALVDEATGIWKKKIVHIQLPLGVKVTVLRWQNYLDLRITMPPQPRQDGSCGNFNGDASDDSTVAIFNRIGARVAVGDLLFRKHWSVEITKAEQKLLQLCPPAQFARAQEFCQNLGTEGSKGCMIDVCFGSNEHALRMATQLGL